MEKQLVHLRRQLFEAKDAAVDAVTEALGRRLKEAQAAYRSESLMRAKLSELRTQQQLEFTLNNNVKAIKEVRFYAPMADGATSGVFKKLVVV